MQTEREQLRRHRRIANECIPLRPNDKHRPLMANHTANPDNFSFARDLWLKIGIHSNAVNQVVTPNGKLVTPRKETIDPYTLSPRELDKYLAERLSPVTNLVDKSVESAYPKGYNDHGIRHPSSVSKLVQTLLKLKNAPEEVQWNAVAAARGHDIGIALTNEAHPFASVPLFQKYLPSITKHPRRWHNIARAIKYHSTDYFRWSVKALDSLPAPERIEKMAKLLGDEGLALVIADKIDVGPWRISSRDERVDNPHTAINLLGRTERETLGIVGKNTFRWELEFIKELTDKDIEAFSHLYAMRKRLQGVDIQLPPFEIWENLFWTTYRERNIFMIESVFALYPQVQTVEINLHDYERLVETTRRFRRDQLDQDIARLRELYPAVKK